MRIAKACKQCRQAKRKCNLSKNKGPCEECCRKKLTCSSSNTTPQGNSSPRNLALSADNEALSTESRLDLINLYLDFLHGKPHTLFHPESLRAATHRGEIEDHVYLAIAGLACRFSISRDVQERKFFFTDSAKTALKAQVDNFCLDTLRACILVGNLYGAEGDSNIESLFFGLAFRIAHILRLPESNDDDGPIVREERVRTWWSLYMIDRWSSAGLNVPRQIPDDGFIPLPMHELDFYIMNTSLNSFNSPRRIGLWAQMVRLARTFGRIQDLHRQHAAGQLDGHQIESLTKELAGDLERFTTELPSEHWMSEENLKRHAFQGLGRDFVALHLGLHHYATLLFFPYLDTQLEVTRTQQIYAKRCTESAAALSDLLTLANSIDGCKPVYFIVAHMTTVSSSALLHDLLFGDEQTLGITRQRLEANFRTLIELRSIWPAAAIAVCKSLATRMTVAKQCYRHSGYIHSRTCVLCPQNQISTKSIDGW